MLHQTFLFVGQLRQMFEVSQILEFLRYHIHTNKRSYSNKHPLPLYQQGNAWVSTEGYVAPRKDV